MPDLITTLALLDYRYEEPSPHDLAVSAWLQWCTRLIVRGATHA